MTMPLGKRSVSGPAEEDGCLCRVAKAAKLKMVKYGKP